MKRNILKFNMYKLKNYNKTKNNIIKNKKIIKK